MKRRVKAVRFAKRNKPTILTVASIVTGGLALYFTAKGTAKSVRDIDKRKKELGVGKLSIKETIRVSWKNYILAAAASGVSLGTNVASEVSHLNKEKTLAAALLASTESLKLIKKEVSEKLGEEGMKEITQKMAEEAPVEGEKKVRPVLTDEDYIVVYDKFSGFKFNTTRRRLHEAETRVNRELNDHPGWMSGVVEYSDFFRWMGANPPRFIDQYAWEASCLWDAWDTAWINFVEEETKDINGANMVILQFDIDPGMKGKAYID